MKIHKACEIFPKKMTIRDLLESARAEEILQALWNGLKLKVIFECLRREESAGALE